MAFFCDKSGARIVAPGTAVSAGGAVPDFDHEDPAHEAAENAAAAALDGEPRGASQAPSPKTIEAAQRAALAALKGPAKHAPKLPKT